MRPNRSLSRVIAAAVVSTTLGFSADDARAELLELEAAIETIPLAEQAGLWIVNLYAVFADPLDVVFNVYCRGLSTTAGEFINVSAIGVAVWDTPLAAQMLVDPSLAYDSFVTIGPATGESNATAIDPNFDVAAFAEQGAICCEAGWYNSFPPNNQGTAGLYPGNKVLLARLTMPLLANGAPAVLSGTLRMTYRDGGMRIIQTDDLPIFVVAPVRPADCNANGLPDHEEIAADPSLDCNRNGVPDPCDLADGTSLDRDGDGTPDECQANPGDLNDDGVVNGEDLGLQLLGWGPCPVGAECAGDLNGDGAIDGADLGDLLLNWNP